MSQFARNAKGEFIRWHFSINSLDHKITETMPRNRYKQGYGKQIPTCHMVRLSDNRWRRVYVMLYSNTGTSYVKANGLRYIIELDN